MDDGKLRVSVVNAMMGALISGLGAAIFGTPGLVVGLIAALVIYTKVR